MTSESTEKSQSNKLLDTLVRVLVPLVRLMIAKGVTFQMASEVLKRVYVKTAQEHFADDDATTGTRLSLLTGLNRKEIRRLTSDETEKQPAEMISYAMATHTTWRTARRWRDRDGRPKSLPRHTVGRQSSFDDLVRSITTDHRPSAVLEELVRLGHVTEDEDGNVRLTDPEFMSLRNFSDRLVLLGDNLEDHANAAVLNVLEPEPRFLERSVFSDEMSRESAEALALVAREHWKRVHDEVFERSVRAEKEDVAAERTTDTRIRVGMYFYSESKDKK
ncbi:MAG: DUF6502 family protein [Usitatibacteraceae bacterium]